MQSTAKPANTVRWQAAAAAGASEKVVPGEGDATFGKNSPPEGVRCARDVTENAANNAHLTIARDRIFRALARRRECAPTTNARARVRRVGRVRRLENHGSLS